MFLCRYVRVLGRMSLDRKERRERDRRLETVEKSNQSASSWSFARSDNRYLAADYLIRQFSGSTLIIAGHWNN